MLASDIVSWVSNTLGFTLGAKVTNPTGVLLARLPRCVLQIHDEQHAGYTPKTLTTLAGVGEYVLGTGYDSVRSRVWPGDWYNIIPSLTGSHSGGSDITAENITSYPGPRYTSYPELRDFQARMTEYGSTLEYPVLWSTYLNESNELVLVLAPSESITAGLTINIDLNISSSAPLQYDSVIPLEAHYEHLLRLMLASEGAAYAQGELLSHSDFAGAREYERLAEKYHVLANTERSRLERSHNPVTQQAEVSKLHTPWFPAVYD